MAYFAVVNTESLDADLKTVADSIRAKAGVEDELNFPDGFVGAINSIENRELAALINRTITQVHDDALTTVGNSAFASCTLLTSADFPAAVRIKEYAFRDCTSLAKINLPTVTTIDGNAFWNCAALTSAEFPYIKVLNNYVFSGCSLLASVDFSAAVELKTYALRGCTSLTSIDLPKATSIAAGAFSGCTNITTLILRSQTVCTLSNTSAFSGTPFDVGGSGGTVYVPQELIEAYQTATNWAGLYEGGACNFRAIEGSEYE